MGRADIVNMKVDLISIFLDEVCIVVNGRRAPTYGEEDGRRVMDRDEITIKIELGRGNHMARIWTCDLSYDYVRINAEYRT